MVLLCVGGWVGDLQKALQPTFLRLLFCGCSFHVPILNIWSLSILYPCIFIVPGAGRWLLAPIATPRAWAEPGTTRETAQQRRKPPRSAPVEENNEDNVLDEPFLVRASPSSSPCYFLPPCCDPSKAPGASLTWGYRSVRRGTPEVCFWGSGPRKRHTRLLTDVMQALTFPFFIFFQMKHHCLKNPSDLCSVNISSQNLVSVSIRGSRNIRELP